MNILDDETSEKIVGLNSFKAYKNKLKNKFFMNALGGLFFLGGMSIYIVDLMNPDFLFDKEIGTIEIIIRIIGLGAIGFYLSFQCKTARNDLRGGELLIKKDTYITTKSGKELGYNGNNNFFILKESGPVEIPKLAKKNKLKEEEQVCLIYTRKSRLLLDVVSATKLNS